MRWFVLLALLLIVTTALARKSRRNRWRFGDEDDDNERTHRKGRKNHKKSSLDSFFTATVGEADHESVERSAKKERGTRKLAKNPPFEAEKDAVEETIEELEAEREAETTTFQPSTTTAKLFSLPPVTSLHDYQPVTPKTKKAERQKFASFNLVNGKHPCEGYECGDGEECYLSEDMNAGCRCRERCYDPSDRDRMQVCSNYNETFKSECHLLQEKCLCREGASGCDNMRNQDVHLEYMGPCKELPQCSEDHLEDFPRRMREWLFNVMKDYADRNELVQQYLEMEKEAENSEKSWVNAVLWKFCDLDLDPEDRHIDRHELISLKAPVVPMEGCLIPFLDNCDTDGNHKITLEEWGQCLTLSENEILSRCHNTHNG